MPKSAANRPTIDKGASGSFRKTVPFTNATKGMKNVVKEATFACSLATSANRLKSGTQVPMMPSPIKAEYDCTETVCTELPPKRVAHRTNMRLDGTSCKAVRPIMSLVLEFWMSSPPTA